jgi:hypothetical protein
MTEEASYNGGGFALCEIRRKKHRIRPMICSQAGFFITGFDSKKVPLWV